MLRKEKELLATVNRPAEAERYKVETLAEGKRTQAVCGMNLFFFAAKNFANDFFFLSLARGSTGPQGTR